MKKSRKKFDIREEYYVSKQAGFEARLTVSAAYSSSRRPGMGAQTDRATRRCARVVCPSYRTFENEDLILPGSIILQLPNSMTMYY